MKYITISEICGLGLSFSIDSFRITYAIIFALMWLMTSILSIEYMKGHKNNARYYIFTLATFISTLGVFLGGDLYTIYIFFEIMSFTSFVWVAQEETTSALRAAKTYLAVAVIGGLVMLMGILLIYNELGTLKIDGLLEAVNKCDNKGVIFSAAICMLVGFGAKAGAFPLHIWLPKAHPVAPAPASALLSGALTKTGVFGIIIITCNILSYNEYWGVIIAVIGAITMFVGAFIALFSIDIKRTLACSSMSQIGFILTGVGMIALLGEDNIIATQGVELYMINHSLIKLVLFMIAGVIYMNVHVLDINSIRGFGRKKPILMISFLIGALAIGGIPGFGGYISKTLIHESILECSMKGLATVIEYVFLISGGFTIAYMTKLFVAVFIEKNDDAEVQKEYDANKNYMNVASRFAIILSALILFIWGMAPYKLMIPLADKGSSFFRVKGHGHKIDFFTITNLEGAIVSIAIATIVYFLVIRKLLMKNKGGKFVYINAWHRFIDLENTIYRPVLLTGIPNICGVISRLLDCFVDSIVVSLRKSFYRDSPLPRERVEGNILTDQLGHMLNVLQFFKNHLWGRKNPKEKDYVHLLAQQNERIRENSNIIQRSLSFGLMMFGIGFMLTLIYILFH